MLAPVDARLSVNGRLDPMADATKAADEAVVQRKAVFVTLAAALPRCGNRPKVHSD